MFAVKLTTRNSNSPIIQPILSLIFVRNFAPDRKNPNDDGTYRGDSAIRIGYKAHHHEKGLLPRLKIKERRISLMPITAKEDEWSPRNAKMGENDFIRIFKDESIEQHELLTHVPDWLRGYRSTNREYSVLMRKRKEFEHWRHTRPLKWLHLEQRIKFLYRRINNKYRPPNVELLHRSRYS